MATPATARELQTTMPVSALRSHPMNVRVYGDLETDADFLNSIQRWGVIDPIVYQPLSFDGGATFENVIVSGHRRFLAARTFKFTEVPVRLAIPDRTFVNEIDLLEIERLVLEANKQRVTGVKHFDLQTVEESYRDPKTTIYAKAYADAFAEVLKLRDIAVKQGAWQRKISGIAA